MATLVPKHTPTTFHLTVYQKVASEEVIIPIPNFVMQHDLGAIRIQGVGSVEGEINIFTTLADADDVKADSQQQWITGDTAGAKTDGLWISLEAIGASGLTSQIAPPCTGIKLAFPAGLLATDGSPHKAIITIN